MGGHTILMISIYAAQPGALLQNLKKAARQQRISPWECDSEGDFTPTRAKERQKAWLRPSAGGNVLNFSFLGPQDVVLEKGVYAFYHGRFLEMLVAHFADQFAEASITAQPEGSDRFLAG
jgi:hypothetical protein